MKDILAYENSRKSRACWVNHQTFKTNLVMALVSLKRRYACEKEKLLREQASTKVIPLAEYKKRYEELGQEFSEIRELLMTGEKCHQAAENLSTYDGTYYLQPCKKKSLR